MGRFFCRREDTFFFISLYYQEEEEEEEARRRRRRRLRVHDDDDDDDDDDDPENDDVQDRRRRRRRRTTRDDDDDHSGGGSKKGPNHECCDQTFVKNAGIATCLPWYGPRFSPHDVPNFYDVSGICENPKAFKAVVDVFVERYEKSSSETDKPTKNRRFRRARLPVRTDDCHAIR